MNRYIILELLAGITDTDLDTLLSLPGDARLADIGLESISFIQFIVALEEEFDFEVLDSDLMISNFRTIDMLFATLQKYFSADSELKKVLVCDCDNCLWHGIAGEEEISTDSATDALHRELIRLQENGVLLCICSKNDPNNIRQAFTLCERLRPEHFLLMKVNRNNKADNLLAVARELNLSLDSFVFLDDSDYELGLINALLPEVATVKADYGKVSPSGEPSFPEEICSYFTAVSSDIDRTRQYREQKEREKCKLKVTGVEEYNTSLETVVTCREADSGQADRIAELSQRTNQCNLACTRYTGEDVLKLLSRKDYTILSLSVKDSYGDMGIVGAAVIRHAPAPVVEAFFLSCRAFDRGFEDVLIRKAGELCPGHLQGIYRESEKNRRFANFYPDHGVMLYEGL